MTKSKQLLRPAPIHSYFRFFNWFVLLVHSCTEMLFTCTIHIHFNFLAQSVSKFPSLIWQTMRFCLWFVRCGQNVKCDVMWCDMMRNNVLCWTVLCPTFTLYCVHIVCYWFWGSFPIKKVQQSNQNHFKTNLSAVNLSSFRAIVCGYSAADFINEYK